MNDLGHFYTTSEGASSNPYVGRSPDINDVATGLKRVVVDTLSGDAGQAQEGDEAGPPEAFTAHPRRTPRLPQKCRVSDLPMPTVHDTLALVMTDGRAGDDTRPYPCVAHESACGGAHDLRSEPRLGVGGYS